MRVGRPLRASRRPGHLVERFVTSLRPGPPRRADVALVTSLLEPAELALWARMPAADRREAVAVLHRLDRLLAGGVHAGDPRWRAAALLHDVGKQASGLGTPGRVVATVAPARGARGFWARIARYQDHPWLGSEMIREAGGRPEPATWAAAHHEPHAGPVPGIPAEVCAALAAADGERWD